MITGGAGYIGSVTNRYLVEQNYETVIFDNLSTGYEKSCMNSPLVVGDLQNRDEILACMKKYQPEAVIHFAAKALAGESMEKPAFYYQNNILGGLNLLEAMKETGCQRIVFSSTCAVYGYPKNLPVTEKEPYKPVSVYGSSKRMFEEILEWYDQIYGIKSAKLRYFNACGATLDGVLGEKHNPETHIIPIALSVAAGKMDAFQLYGQDYDTPDGTCIRDYIHVLDLADAHLKALTYLESNDKSLAVNLGVGHGISNLEIIKAVENITGRKIKVENKPRRFGDPDRIYADNSLAKNLLSWSPQYSDSDRIIGSAWQYYQKNPS